MGVADLLAAFNQVTVPNYVCTRALMSQERADGVQWQKLRFSGNDAAGAAFSVDSDRLPAGADLVAASRVVAANLLAG